MTRGQIIEIIRGMGYNVSSTNGRVYLATLGSVKFTAASPMGLLKQIKKYNNI